MADERAEFDVNRLVAEQHKAVYGYAYRLTGSAPDAEDLTQQVFLIAQQKLGQLRKIGSARSWLFAILRSCFLRTRQRRRPVPAANLRLNIENIPAEVVTDEQIDRERLQEAISELPDGFRLVLLMFYFEGQSYREIAAGLDIPIGTVMSRLARAKGFLRSRLFQPETDRASRRQPSTAG